MLDSLGQDPVLSALPLNEGVDVPPLPARGKSLWQLPTTEKLKIRVIGARNVTAGELYKVIVSISPFIWLTLEAVIFLALYFSSK